MANCRSTRPCSATSMLPASTTVSTATGTRVAVPSRRATRAPGVWGASRIWSIGYLNWWVSGAAWLLWSRPTVGHGSMISAVAAGVVGLAAELAVPDVAYERRGDCPPEAYGSSASRSPRRIVAPETRLRRRPRRYGEGPGYCAESRDRSSLHSMRGCASRPTLMPWRVRRGDLNRD